MKRNEMKHYSKPVSPCWQNIPQISKILSINKYPILRLVPLFILRKIRKIDEAINTPNTAAQTERVKVYKNNIYIIYEG